MNTETKKAEYFTRKDNVAAINKQISEKKAQIKELKDGIAETDAVIRSTAERLKIEERELGMSGPLSRRTMTHSEFMEQKAHLAEWQTKLSELNAALDLHNQELAFLQDDLAKERPYLITARSKVVDEVVDQAFQEFSAVAAEPLKKLVLAIIAKTGKNSGFTSSQYQAFRDATYKAICEKILPSIFQDGGLPDLSEANNFITETIESKAA